MAIYAKVNASMPWNDKVADLSDGAFRAYVKVICGAKQRESPEFSKAAILDVLGAHGRFLKTLTSARLVDVVGSKYVVHDYEEHQSSDRYDPTAARRNREYRARMKAESNGYPPVDDGGDNGSGTSRRDVSVTSRAHGARAEQSITEQSSDKKHAPSVREDDVSDDVPDDEVRVDRDHPYNVFRQVTGWDASPKRQMLIDDMTRDHGRDLLVRAFRAVGRPERGTDFFGEVRQWIQAYIDERNARRTRRQAELDAEQIRQAHELEDRLRRQGMTDDDAAANRAAIASFVSGFSIQEGKS